MPGPGSYQLPSEFGIYESSNKERFIKQEEDKWNRRAKSSEGVRRPNTAGSRGK